MGKKSGKKFVPFDPAKVTEKKSSQTVLYETPAYRNRNTRYTEGDSASGFRNTEQDHSGNWRDSKPNSEITRCLNEDDKYEKDAKNIERSTYSSFNKNNTSNFTSENTDGGSGNQSRFRTMNSEENKYVRNQSGNNRSYNDRSFSSNIISRQHCSRDSADNIEENDQNDRAKSSRFNNSSQRDSWNREDRSSKFDNFNRNSRQFPTSNRDIPISRNITRSNEVDKVEEDTMEDSSTCFEQRSTMNVNSESKEPTLEMENSSLPKSNLNVEANEFQPRHADTAESEGSSIPASPSHPVPIDHMFDDVTLHESDDEHQNVSRPDDHTNNKLPNEEKPITDIYSENHSDNHNNVEQCHEESFSTVCAKLKIKAIPKTNSSDDSLSQSNNQDPENKKLHSSPRLGNVDKKKRDYLVDTIDDEWKEYEMYKKGGGNKPVEFKVIEEQKDLFSVGEEYSLAHCVAEDLSMGSGIAVEFKRKFKEIGNLYDQRQKQGGLAILETPKDRYIYYLVTKRESSGKPTYSTFWNSTKKLRDHIKDNKVKKLAIPRLGCGLDRLEWDDVRSMIEFLFRDVEVEILVCNFQQVDVPISPGKLSRGKLVHADYSISKIESGTMIIFFITEDNHVTKEMEELDEKFSILPVLRQQKKTMGEVIRIEKNYYIFYGCVVKKQQESKFSFQALQQCAAAIQKLNKKDLYSYAGFQKVYEEDDYKFSDKIGNLLRNIISNVDVYLCSPLNS